MDLLKNLLKSFVIFLPIFLIVEASADEGSIISADNTNNNSLNNAEDGLIKMYEGYIKKDMNIINKTINNAPSNSFSSSSQNAAQAFSNYEFLIESLQIKNTPNGYYWIPSDLLYPSENATLFLPEPSHELNSLKKINNHFEIHNNTNYVKLVLLNNRIFLFNEHNDAFKAVNDELNSNKGNLKVFSSLQKDKIILPATTIPLLDGFTVSDGGEILTNDSHKAAKSWSSLEKKIFYDDPGSNLSVMFKRDNACFKMVSRIGIINPRRF